MATKPKKYRFKVLIPTKTKEIEKLFVYESLALSYDRAIHEMEEHVRELIDNEEFEASEWKTERRQFEFVLQRMLWFLEETYNFEKNLIKEAGAGLLAKYPSQNSGASGRRGTITAEVKAKVKTLVLDGRSGAEVAAALGISLPSVQNIKKEFGLMKR